mmetsp:Transcript_24497/g.35854  ORF Transcript_24497/g.35854 Transcript_24497/m.35854 type:complete len:422 (+) Transcript_24497:35-1300(+)|eukprot:CAMPEP_0195510446 /NCGR_PEP_ID=MMETSP0794_2-20130614/3088_1 /TAXON_ID=515487 /ORGANISM="Stephanopyxis turris, Strain CCMP 815" /LENGTH=421 /DNA_ID=CAMNT_0040637869 /DNA_START=23 /DNA_END=1288 /DNA_ORIENTATION=-
MPSTIPETASLIKGDPETRLPKIRKEDPAGIAEVSFSELVLGRTLGRGGFSAVHEILEIDLQPNKTSSDEQERFRTDLANTCHDPIDSQPKYVIKMLRPDLPGEERTKGIADLALEAKFLVKLRHPNIITMRATSDMDPLDRNANYFVILDKLYCTLEMQLDIWRRDVAKFVGCLFGCCKKLSKLHGLWIQRISVALNIACAVQYLHSLGIIYRDLKPENVGFDECGVVKLFDFGLAKAIHPEDRNPTNRDLYNLTGNTGSLRYMAPEVALGRPYDSRVDAYSFGILFWQICSLAVPYAGYSCKMHADLVVGKGYRPKLNHKSWPENWCELMKECWAGDLYLRPNFDSVVSALNAEVRILEESEPLQIKPRKKKSGRVGKDGAMLDDARLPSFTSGSSVKERNVYESAGVEHQLNFDSDVV